MKTLVVSYHPIIGDITVLLIHINGVHSAKKEPYSDFKIKTNKRARGVCKSVRAACWRNRVHGRVVSDTDDIPVSIDQKLLSHFVTISLFTSLTKLT